MTQANEGRRTMGGRRARLTVSAALIIATVAFCVLSRTAQATFVSGPDVTVSLDTSALAATPAWTPLPTIAVTELAADDVAAGQTSATLVLRAPAGWEFRGGAGQVFAPAFLADITSIALAVTSSHLAITLSTDDLADGFDSILLAGIEVRPTTATPNTGTIHRPSGQEGGTALASGIAATPNADGAGGTSFGSLTAVVGMPVALAVETLDANSTAGSATTALTAGTPFAVRLHAVDQFGNPTAASGDATMTFATTAGSAPDGTAPNIPATSASSFVGGTATVGDFVLTNAEAGATVSASVSDPGTSGIAPGAGGTSVGTTVSPGVVGDFVIEKNGGGEIGAVPALTPFSVQITARDAFRNPATSGPNNFTGADSTVVLTSNVSAVNGLGLTPPFVDGKLTDHTVTLAEPSAAAILTATRSDGSNTTGSSSLFVVEGGQPPVLTVPAPLTVIAETTSGSPNPDQLGLIATFLASASAVDAIDGSPVAVTTDAPAFFPVGVTDVEFSAADAGGAFAAATVGVEVISASEALARLDARVRDQDLPWRIERDLLRDLADARHAVDRGWYRTAIRALGSFSSRVRYDGGRYIPPTVGFELLTAAQRIADVLSLRIAAGS